MELTKIKAIVSLLRADINHFVEKKTGALAMDTINQLWNFNLSVTTFLKDQIDMDQVKSLLVAMENISRLLQGTDFTPLINQACQALWQSLHPVEQRQLEELIHPKIHSENVSVNLAEPSEIGATSSNYSLAGLMQDCGIFFPLQTAAFRKLTAMEDATLLDRLPAPSK